MQGTIAFNTIQTIRPALDKLSFNIWNCPVGVPNHHLRTTASSGSGIGEKGMINAAKILALFGIRAMTDPVRSFSCKAVNLNIGNRLMKQFQKGRVTLLRRRAAVM